MTEWCFEINRLPATCYGVGPRGALALRRHGIAAYAEDPTLYTATGSCTALAVGPRKMPCGRRRPKLHLKLVSPAGQRSSQAVGLLVPCDPPVSRRRQTLSYVRHCQCQCRQDSLHSARCGQRHSLPAARQRTALNGYPLVSSTSRAPCSEQSLVSFNRGSRAAELLSCLALPGAKGLQVSGRSCAPLPHSQACACMPAQAQQRSWTPWQQMDMSS